MSSEYAAEPEVVYTPEIRETWSLQLHDDPMALHVLADLVNRAAECSRIPGAGGTFRFIDPDQLVITVTRPYEE